MKVWNGNYYMLKSLNGNQTYKYSHEHLRKMSESCPSIGHVHSSENYPDEGSPTGENTEL